jgi:CPA2 family monovalent cation:H+ antiporter-2
VLEDALLRDLVLTYALALVLIVGFARLRVSPIVAFIATGTIAGPTGIGLVGTQEEVQTLAEIGIVLLLFAVGLDFSLGDFRRLWQRVVGGGILQIGATAAAVLVVLVAATDRSARVSLFIGLFIALSSTAIVLKELSARNQLDAPHGRLMVGVLLFQDLCMVALLLLVPLLSGETPPSAVPAVIGRALLAIAIVAGVSRFVLPALLGFVARSGRREAFSLAVVVAAVGTAWASSLLGISTALGAFLGGLVLAESEFSYQAHAEIRPVRDLLAGLFFISLGMLLDIGFIARQLPMVAAITVFIIVVKAGAAAAALRLVATPLRVALTSGIGLAQVGEFSFILGRSGLDAGLLTPSDWQTLLGASMLTMVLTPLMISVAPGLGRRMAGGAGTHVDLDVDSEIPKLSDHVIVLGFGVGGQIVARALRELGTPYLVLELNGTAVRTARQKGEPIFFGDATSPDALAAAGIERARALVAVLSDPDASVLAVRAARVLSATVPVIVRARYRREASTLVELGATIAVAEEFEASLEVLTQLLARLHVPGNAVEMLLEGFRRPSTGARPLRAVSRRLEDLSADLGDIPIATHQLHDGEWAAGRTVSEIDLRAKTGALIIAVRHGSQNFPSPPADLRLDPGDILYLMGPGPDIVRARRLLSAGE